MQLINLKDERIAEMKFLRGYFYLDLKKWYKWIPYYDENVTYDSIAKLPNHPDSAQNDLIYGKIYTMILQPQQMFYLKHKQTKAAQQNMRLKQKCWNV